MKSIHLKFFAQLNHQQQISLWALLAFATPSIVLVFELGVLVVFMAIFAYVTQVRMSLLERKLPMRLIWLCIVLGWVSIFAQYKTFLGQEAGISIFWLLLNAKAFESKNIRDWQVVIALSLFLTALTLFISQSIWMCIWVVVCVFVCLVAWTRCLGVPWQEARQVSVVTMLAALPLMFVLFVMTPRLAGPLWSLPSNQSGASSGLSDSMSPGSVSQMIKSNEPAFSVEVLNGSLSKAQMYWRVLVLERYDGRTWTSNRKDDRIFFSGAVSGDRVSYSMMITPEEKRIPSLDYVSTSNNQLVFSTGHTLRMRLASQQKIQLELSSSKSDRLFERLSLNNRISYLQLPSANSRTKQWAQAYREQTPVEKIKAVYGFFKAYSFSYTLEPPLLGENAVDEFLYDSRAGFCEHYANAAAFMFRSMGMPARVVLGYQGGEWNSEGEFWQVKSSDAHAWIEVYRDDLQAWQRLDPTSWVSPDRVELGIEQAIPSSQLQTPFSVQQPPEWLKSALQKWSAVQYNWQRWVISYDLKRQQSLWHTLQKTGIGLTWIILILLATAFICMYLFIFLRQKWQDKQQDPLVRGWYLLIAKLQKQNMAVQLSMGPQTVYQLLMTKNDFDKQAVYAQVIAEYIQCTYQYPSHSREAHIQWLEKVQKL